MKVYNEQAVKVWLCTLFTLLNCSASWVTIKEKGGDEDGKILY